MAPSLTKRVARTPAAKKTKKSEGNSSGIESGAESDAPKRVATRRKSITTAPKKHAEIEYEFGGPIGALGVIVGLPLVIFLLYFLCNKDVCLNNPFRFAWGTWFTRHLPHSISELYTNEAMYMYVGWMIFHVLLERILPGETVEGVVLDDGKRLPYTMSGHLQFWITLVVMGHAYPLFIESAPVGSTIYEFRGFRPLDLSLIYDHYVQLIFVSVIGASLLSVYLYWSSFLGKKKILAKGGDTGNMVYDFFIGRELNPRIGSIDLKGKEERITTSKVLLTQVLLTHLLTPSLILLALPSLLSQSFVSFDLD